MSPLSRKSVSPAAGSLLALTFLLTFVGPWSIAAKEPTPEEQYFVELLNRSRANPEAEASRFGIALNEGPPSVVISATPKPPLALKTEVLNAANHHLCWVNSGHGTFGHSATGEIGKHCFTGAEFWDRLAYVNQAFGSAAENLVMSRKTNVEAAIQEMHQQLFVDAPIVGRLHRVNILNDLLTDVGVAFGEGGPYGKVAVQLFIQDPASGAKLTGVVIDDKDGDQFYTIGEGLGGVDIEIIDSNVKGKTWASGGYSLDISSLSKGEYRARFTRDGKVFETTFNHRGDRNVKVDALAARFVSPSESTPPAADPTIYAPTISAFSASDSELTCGQTTTLRWTIKDAASASIEGVGNILPMTNGEGIGTIEVAPSDTTRYTLTVENKSGKNQAQTLVEVRLVADLNATASRITVGESVSLSWNVCPGAAVSISPGFANLASRTNAQGAGSVNVSPDRNTTYTLTTSSGGKSETRQVSVAVEAPAVVEVPSALVAYWDFNDADHASSFGASVDSVGAVQGYFNGAVLTGDKQGRTGRSGDRALDTSGGDLVVSGEQDMAFLNKAQASDTVTFSFWQKLNSLTESSAFLALANGAGGDWAAQAAVPWSGDTIYFDTAGCCDESTQRLSGPAPNGHDFTGTWNHYAFVKDERKKSVWVNGVKAFEGINTAPLPKDFYALFIGVQYDDGSVVDGLIDEFAVFASALSEAAITKLAAGVKADQLSGGSAKRPVIDTVVSGTSRVELSFKGAVGKTYRVEFSPDLRNWSTIDSGLSGVIRYKDTHATRVGKSSGYYRVVEE